MPQEKQDVSVLQTDAEIGHGMLAERALIPVIPSQEEFPMQSEWYPKYEFKRINFNGFSVDQTLL